MFENMAGFVGYAMHDDLMMRTAANTRVAEATRMWRERRRAMPRQSYREAVARAFHYRKAADVDADGWKKAKPVARYRVTLAQMLLAVATRIAPTVTLSRGSQQAVDARAT